MSEGSAGTERAGGAERPPESGGAAPGRGGRMSRQRKTAAVLQLLRGEDLETVSRGLGVTAATLSEWRDAFLAAGEASLATRHKDGEQLDSERLKARLGDMSTPPAFIRGFGRLGSTRVSHDPGPVQSSPGSHTAFGRRTERIALTAICSAPSGCPATRHKSQDEAA